MGAKLYDGKIIKILNTLPQNISETITNGHGKEIPKERSVTPEKRENFFDYLRLKGQKIINLLDNTAN